MTPPVRLLWISLPPKGTGALDFLVSGPASASLAPHAQVTVSVTYRPRKDGAAAARIKVTSNATGNLIFWHI